MNSRITAEFRQAFANLPNPIQEQTRQAYRQFKQNPRHPSLRFKKVHPQLPIYSTRINKSYRVVGVLQENTVIWFWVGSHTDYEKLLSRL
ncbi:MAG: hypothetical protein WBA77_02030 [Microcoleaceae cyanobacterium]